MQVVLHHPGCRKFLRAMITIGALLVVAACDDDTQRADGDVSSLDGHDSEELDSAVVPATCAESLGGWTSELDQQSAAGLLATSPSGEAYFIWKDYDIVELRSRSAEGTWSTVASLPPLNEYDLLDFAIADGGSPVHVLVRTRSSGDIPRYGVFDGSQADWFLDDQLDPLTGIDLDLEVGADGAPMIAFENSAHRPAAAVRGADGTWSVEVPDETTSFEFIMGFALHLAENGEVEMCYVHDAGQISCAHRFEADAWTVEKVFSEEWTQAYAISLPPRGARPVLGYSAYSMGQAPGEESSGLLTVVERANGGTGRWEASNGVVIDSITGWTNDFQARVVVANGETHVLFTRDGDVFHFADNGTSRRIAGVQCGANVGSITAVGLPSGEVLVALHTIQAPAMRTQVFSHSLR